MTRLRRLAHLAALLGDALLGDPHIPAVPAADPARPGSGPPAAGPGPRTGP